MRCNDMTTILHSECKRGTHDKRSGFTLVELMVVAVIVAIMAAVSLSLLTGNRVRAMITEAEAGAGTVRTMLRTMYVQTGAYNIDLNGDAIAAVSPVTAVPGINSGDLDGRYFDDAAYSITVSANNFTVIAEGNDSGAARAADVAGITVSLTKDGSFTRSGL
jgi:prepilin-type N-terminal cleavage/methylation domain-containing protein